jgi:DNA-binding CsgD family transcriptional regulator
MAHKTGLIAAIYDASLEPSGWEDILRRIAEATKSTGAVLLEHEIDPATRQIGGAGVSSLWNIDPAYADAFVKTYSKINPLNQAALAIAPGEVLAATLITQTREFRATRFYNEFLRPQNCADCVGIGLSRTSIVSQLLSFHRPPGAVAMEPARYRLLESLAPHLARAVQIQNRLWRAGAISGALGAAFAAVGFAIFILGADCQVLFANAKAEALVRCEGGLRYEQRRLLAETAALTARLHGLAQSAARGAAGGSLALPCKGEGAPILAHIIPLAAHRAGVFGLSQPAAALIVADQSAGTAAHLRSFSAKFGLTAGEARVLAEIIIGKGLAAAAAQLRITHATARSHTDSIFQKTGTSRQAELIRCFFECTLSRGYDPATL